MTDLTVVNLDDHRPHETRYVACMECAADWIAVVPLGTGVLECEKCGEMAGETVRPTDKDFFRRFMRAGLSKSQTTKRTMVLINAANAWKDHTHD